MLLWQLCNFLYQSIEKNLKITFINQYFFSRYMLIFDIYEQIFWSFIKRFVHWFLT